MQCGRLELVRALPAIDPVQLASSGSSVQPSSKITQPLVRTYMYVRVGLVSMRARALGPGLADNSRLASIMLRIF